ncbi:MAG: hypothetical protein OEZ39_20050 [Gammaproteobacteria bacterium]|nr:hypothetical protein [Gammaproteobacteria bacterium]MDH5654162.1 hypothetical protein [Gammaproteobacteria bacterium]
MRIESAGYRQEFSIDESTLDKFVLPEAKDVSIKRNLFVPVTARQVSTIPTKVQKKSEIKAVVNNNTALYVDLNTFRLEGVLDNGGKIQAFLSSNDNVYMVYKGDRFADHYIAEKVSLEGILLRDESKGVSKWIALSGE